MIYLALAGFTMMILQTALTYLQYRNYQAAVKSLLNKDVFLGIGLRKGGFQISGGAIVILSMNRLSGRIVTCKKLQGIAIWKRFKEVDDYNNYSLDELRELAILEDYELNRKQRDKVPYSKEMADKKRKKGALLQAIEALDLRIDQEKKNALNTKRLNEQRAKEVNQSRHKGGVLKTVEL